MNSSKIKWFVFIVIGVLLLTGCGKKKSDGGNEKYISLSSTNLTIKKGSTQTFDLSLSNAVGLFNISSNNSSIVTVDNDTVWLEAIDVETDTKTITVSGNEVGSTEIVISLSDVATYDTEKTLTGSYTINVKVE